MIPLAQIPGADQAIQSAAREGWVAVLLVVLVLAICGTFVFTVHQVLRESRERETRLSTRLDEAADFQRGDLLAALREASLAMSKMLSAAEAICQAASAMTDSISHCRLVNQREPLEG